VASFRSALDPPAFTGPRQGQPEPKLLYTEPVNRSIFSADGPAAQATIGGKMVRGRLLVLVKSRFGARQLLPGSYRLQLTPRTGGKTGKTVSATFGAL
jgi:hypothetical protein